MKEKKQKKVFIYGKHILEEALNNKPESIKKAFLSLEHKDTEIYRKLKNNNIPVFFTKSKEAGKIVGKEIPHQGFIALLDLGKLIFNFDDFLKNLQVNENTAFVFLDELKDPQNVGSIIRSAAAFNVSAVFLPVHRQSGITGAVVKASAGMVFALPIVEVGNVNYALDVLKKEYNFKIVALDVSGKPSLENIDFKGPLVFILGSEGFGIREKTLERAEVKIKIPISPKCESLNVGVSAGIVFYVWYKNRFLRK